MSKLLLNYGETLAMYIVHVLLEANQSLYY